MLRTTGRGIKAVWAEAEQGFVTARGRFISRADAWIIADRGGQLGPEIVTQGSLHSEDLASGHYGDPEHEA